MLCKMILTIWLVILLIDARSTSGSKNQFYRYHGWKHVRKDYVLGEMEAKMKSILKISKRPLKFLLQIMKKEGYVKLTLASRSEDMWTEEDNA